MYIYILLVDKSCWFTYNMQVYIQFADVNLVGLHQGWKNTEHFLWNCSFLFCSAEHRTEIATQNIANVDLYIALLVYIACDWIIAENWYSVFGIGGLKIDVYSYFLIRSSKFRQFVPVQYRQSIRWNKIYFIKIVN